MNRLSMDERQTIIGLLRLGWKQRRIARETGFHRVTVRRIAGELADEVSKCTTPPGVATDSARSRSACEPHRAFIQTEVAKGRNAVAIYQDLVEHHGYAGAYNAVKRFVGKLRPPNNPKISCRFETAPGQEAQVDYGEGALTRHPKTGKYRRPRLFIMKLSNSRRSFRKVV